MAVYYFRYQVHNVHIDIYYKEFGIWRKFGGNMAEVVRDINVSSIHTCMIRRMNIHTCKSSINIMDSCIEYCCYLPIIISTLGK